MKPKINILEKTDGGLKRFTREMTNEEYAEYQEMLKLAEESKEE